MAYHEHIVSICERLGISPDSIHEDNVNIDHLIFSDPNHSTKQILVIKKTPRNLVERLFIEVELNKSSKRLFRINSFDYGDSLRQEAATVFAEVWGTFDEFRRPFLFGLACYNRLDIIWKDDTF